MVSPRDTLLRGQSIIKYVLIIAIIGVVIVLAGPDVTGAIRNQFNLIGYEATNNICGYDENAAVKTTSDKLFPLSYFEIVESPYSDWTTWS